MGGCIVFRSMQGGGRWQLAPTSTACLSPNHIPCQILAPHGERAPYFAAPKNDGWRGRMGKKKRRKGGAGGGGAAAGFVDVYGAGAAGAIDIHHEEGPIKLTGAQGRVQVQQAAASSRHCPSLRPGRQRALRHKHPPFRPGLRFPQTCRTCCCGCWATATTRAGASSRTNRWCVGVGRSVGQVAEQGGRAAARSPRRCRAPAAACCAAPGAPASVPAPRLLPRCSAWCWPWRMAWTVRCGRPMARACCPAGAARLAGPWTCRRATRCWPPVKRRTRC